MLYTPSHAELAQHPKTRKLARLLGVSIPTAIGHLHLLWHFALKYAPDGDLSRFVDADIADGCMWDGDPQTLCVALHGSGFVDTSANDEPLRIWLHDWEEYGGKLVRRQEANAQRMRDARAKQQPSTKKPRAAHVQRTTVARVEPEEKRLEERREEDKGLTSLAAADAPRQGASSLRPVPKPKDTPPPRNEQWDALIEGTGVAPQTATERGLLGKMARELRDAGKSGAEILAACENYRERWPDVDITWTSIVKHFSLNEHPPPVRALPSRESLGRPAGVMSQDFIEQMKRSRQRGDSA